MTLRQARLLADINQYQLEEATGIAQSLISLYEKGYRKPSDQNKQKLAVALGCDVTAIDWDNPKGKRDLPTTPILRHGCADTGE